MKKIENDEFKIKKIKLTEQRKETQNENAKTKNVEKIR